MKLNQARIAELEKYINEMMEKYQVPGMAIAIAHGEDVLYSKGFGYRKKEEEKEINSDTILGIASISKSFGGLAVTQLVEQGKMSYNDPITKYYPNFKVPGDLDPSEITIHHMLTHTAGFPPLESLGYSMIANTEADPDEDRSRFTEDYAVNTHEELVDFMSMGNYEMLGKPGEYASYSNDCYALIGGVVEKVSGLSFDEYAKKYIFEPLKMNRSMFDLKEVLNSENVTDPYYEKDGEIKHSKNWQEAPPYLACGWVRSTANDLIKYAQMYANQGELFGNKVVSKQGIKKMMSEGINFTSRSTYGYGVTTQKEYNGLTLVEHGGSLKGVSSHFGFVPEKNLSAVVLCNLTGVAVVNIWLAAINTALSLPLETKRKEYGHYSWQLSELEPFVGEYISGEGSKAKIFIEEEKLFANLNNQDIEIEMVEANLGIVNIKDRTREVTFYQNDKKGAWAIGFGGRIIPKKRKAQE